jgi:hypothetical protein
MNDFDQMAQSQSTPAAAPSPAVAPATSTGNDFEQMAQQAASTPASTTGTNQPASPSYLSQVEGHIANTAHAIWHGATGQEESDVERGAKAGQFKQFGFTNENAGYNIGALGRGVVGFLGGFAKDALSKMPIIMPDDKKISWSDPKANTLIGKYIAAPSEAERQKSLAEAEAYTGTKGTTAIGHLLNTYIHTAGEYIPVAGPFVASLVDKAESGDIGGAATQVAALAAAHPVAEAIKEKVGYAPKTDNWWEKQKADAKAATATKPVVTAPVASVPRNPEIGPQERTVSGPQTTLRPTTQTTAGVTAPISALQQENVSPLATVGAKLASPGSDAEFQKTQTQPAARRQLISTIGQAAEDKIAKHEAIMDGKPTPNPIAGSQTPSKFQTFDDAAKASELSATKTYQKADAVSDRDIAAWQTATRDALNEHKAAVDRYNQMVDQYNENRNTADDKEMPRATYDPNAVSIPEKPQSYSELKAELDRAKAEGASSDAAVREEAYKTGIPKAEKAIDQWFKQHSDDISPAEYASAKSLYADSQRFQEVANGLRSATNKGTLTGNTLRGLESTIDNKMIRRGQAPGAFQRLLGDDAYDNWTNVAKLFDPVKGALQGQKSWGTYATEYIVASVLGIKGIAAKAATELLMNRVMFHPEWGQWFSKFTNTLKNLATREHGELGAPGAVGEAFGQDDKQHFYDLMNAAPGKAAGGVTVQTAAPQPSLLDQVHTDDLAYDRRATEPVRVHPPDFDPAVRDPARLNPFPGEDIKIKVTPGEAATETEPATNPVARITGPHGSSIELELDGKTARVKGILNSGVPGDGQRLYDNAIHWAKDSGYDTFEGDKVQTEDAKTAWQRISERHKARMADTFPHTPSIDLTGSRPAPVAEVAPKPSAGAHVTHIFNHVTGNVELIQ